MQWSSFFKDNLKPVMAYQPGLRQEQIQQMVQADTIYKLSSNESPLPPYPAALAAMQKSLSLLNEYPEGSCYRLTQQLADHFNIPAQQIVIGNGSNELIDLIATTCLTPGDNVVYCWPSFVVYRSCAQIAGADHRELALAPNASFDLDALLAAIDDKTKIVFVCTPNNPTGAVVKRTDFERFLSQVPAHVLVVVDAAYEEFVDDEQAVRPLDYFDGQRPYVVLHTFSKAYALAGMRCGYGFVPAVLADMLHKVREPFNVNTLSQVAAEASFGDQEELWRRVELNAKGRQQLQQCFAQLGLKAPVSQGNFVWVEVPDAAATFEELQRRGIIVRPFAGANGLRVGVGDPQGVAATITAFTEIFG